METLEIISTSITVQAKKTINGNTVNFAWNYLQGEMPHAINFNAQRGVAGDSNYTGNTAISGAFYPETEKFDTYNENFKDGDLVLYQEILTICKDIVADLQTI